MIATVIQSKHVITKVISLGLSVRPSVSHLTVGSWCKVSRTQLTRSVWITIWKLNSKCVICVCHVTVCLRLAVNNFKKSSSLTRHRQTHHHHHRHHRWRHHSDTATQTVDNCDVSYSVKNHIIVSQTLTVPNYTHTTMLLLQPLLSISVWRAYHYRLGRVIQKWTFRTQRPSCHPTKSIKALNGRQDY